MCLSFLPSCRVAKGFTLAELLISLAILAVIATFTIPKVLQNEQEQKRKAIFKEDIAILSALTNEISYTQTFTTVADEISFFDERLNYIKRCPTGPSAEGCWSSGAGGDPSNAIGYILPNGSMISSVNGGGGFSSRETVFIDWNGLLPPNVLGDDIMYVTMCWGETPCNTGYAPILQGSTASGAVGPHNAPSVALYNTIFSN